MKSKKQKKKKKKITPSTIAGMGIGLLLMGGGLYIGISKGEFAGYFSVALGLLLIVLIGIIARR
jgi:hypothetical protein